jgi:DNA modification methylase
MASILTNRKYIGFELNDEYYQLCLKNINDLNSANEVNINE